MHGHIVVCYLFLIYQSGGTRERAEALGFSKMGKLLSFVQGGPDPSARVFEVFLIVLDGVQGETLWEGESRARNHTHKR